MQLNCTAFTLEWFLGSAWQHGFTLSFHSPTDSRFISQYVTPLNSLLPEFSSHYVKMLTLFVNHAH